MVDSIPRRLKKKTNSRMGNTKTEEVRAQALGMDGEEDVDNIPDAGISDDDGSGNNDDVDGPSSLPCAFRLSFALESDFAVFVLARVEPAWVQACDGGDLCTYACTTPTHCTLWDMHLYIRAVASRGMARNIKSGAEKVCRRTRLTPR